MDSAIFENLLLLKISRFTVYTFIVSSRLIAEIFGLVFARPAGPAAIPMSFLVE